MFYPKVRAIDWIRREGQRLAYYKLIEPYGSEYWNSLWINNISPIFYRRYQCGRLHPYHRIFLKHLPKEGKILEAGCGMAHYVLALRVRGYDCIGIDYAYETIKKVRSILPNLPVMVSDVSCLSFKDNSFSGYISLGVVEHFQEGPTKLLNDAYRVLCSDGVIIVSVPQVHPWREKIIHSETTPIPFGMSFYQYAFQPDEFASFLKNAGFKIIAEYGLGVQFALCNRFPFLRTVFNHFPKLGRILDFILDRTYLGLAIGRMRVWVGRKEVSH